MVMPAAVTLNNLTVSYCQHPALHHLNGNFIAGSLTAVIGPNGSGKSTLLKSIAGLLPTGKNPTADTGANALQVSAPRQRVGYLAQVTDMDKSFPLRVWDCVALGCWATTGAWGGVTAAMREKIDAALHAVGLQGFEDRSIGSLSSGQLQRALFARLLVQDADLILLDEPFNAVDSNTSAALLALVLQWHRQGRTVIAVLHDDALVRTHFPDTLLLARKLVDWGATNDVLTPANLARARRMAEAWDESAELCDVDVSPTMHSTQAQSAEGFL
jgi:zinc/manganese transport system ATP-binding protein